MGGRVVGKKVGEAVVRHCCGVKKKKKGGGERREERGERVIIILFTVGPTFSKIIKVESLGTLL